MGFAISSHIVLKAIRGLVLMSSLLVQGHIVSNALASELGNSPAEGPAETHAAHIKKPVDPDGSFPSRVLHWTSATMLSDGGVLLRNAGRIVAEQPRTRFIEAKRVHIIELDLTVTQLPKVLKVLQPVSQAVVMASDGVVVLRFAHPFEQPLLNDQNVTLTGPTGPAQVQIVLSDDKRHAVVIPMSQLFPGSPYTLFIQGFGETRLAHRPLMAIPLKTIALEAKPELLALATNGAQSQPNDIVDDEDWAPTIKHWGGHWRSGLPFPHKTTKIRRGQTTIWVGDTVLKGQVLRLNGKPLPDVTVRIGNVVTQTDQSGSFVLKGLQNGHHELIVDGRSATRDGKKYSVYALGVDLKGGILNELDYAIWLPKIRNKDLTHIPSPTTQEILITHPDIPGLEVHIPPHTVIRDHEGNVVTEIAVTPVPLDKAPFPVPENFPVYFMISPGGAVVQSLDPLNSPGIRIVYPNYTGHKAGSRVSFWVYDSRQRGWFVYGFGRISPDGQSVQPDPGVGLHEHMAGGHSLEGGPDPAQPEATECDECSGCAQAADPVDCHKGLFVLPRTDAFLPDVLPIKLTRTYRPGDTIVRPFGVGSTHPFAMYLYNPDPNQQYPNFDVLALVLPDSALIRFQRVPGIGTDLHTWVWEHKATPSRFYGAELRAATPPSGEIWTVKLKDGTVYELSALAGNDLIGITDRFGNRLTVTRSAGLVTRLTTPSGRYLAFTYDINNRITQAQDILDRVWTYQYDPNGMLQRVTYPDTTFEEYTYDSNGRMLTVKDRRGNIMVSNQYDSTTGRVAQQTLAPGTPDQAINQFAYTTDGSGNVTQTDVTDPRGNIRRITYHSSGYPATDTRAYGTPQAQTITYVRDDTSGLPLSKTDALGRKTTYAYDAKGNILSITRLADTPEAVTETFTYTTDYNQIATHTDPLNHTTTLSYDTLGRLISVTNPLTQQTTFTYNGAGQVLTITDPLNHTTTFSYDLGDLRTITNALNQVKTLFTDTVGRISSVTDPLGRRTQFEYNNDDRVTKVTDALKKVTEFTYDGNGNLLTVKDPKNQTTTFGYDVRNRRISRTDPLLRVENVTYDGMSNLTSMTDRTSQTTTYQYDGLNRRTLATYQGGTTSTSYTYDAGDRLTQIADSVSGTTTRTYDNLNRLTSDTTPQGSVSYTYDNASRRASMTVAGQSAVTYSYDNADRVTSITQGTSSVTVAYDAASRTTQVTLPNNLAMVYAYDNANQLTGITYKQGVTALGDLTYAYDNAGRRTTVGGTWARSGLPVAATAASITLNANNQALTFAGTTMTYDLNGNLATAQDASGTATYTWDVRNRLTGLTSPGFSASFAYDALGRRTGKTVQGVTTNYVYDGLNPVQEKNGSTVTANLLTGLGVDQVFTRTDSTGTREFFTDALGSTMALVDTSGAVQTSYTYEPFGGTSQNGTANTNSYKYTGREDDGTGLFYYRARYYSPRLQRFVSEDPIGFRGRQINLYGYVGNTPTSYVDPLGLFDLQFGVQVGVNAYSFSFINGNFDRQAVFPPNFGGGVQCRIDEPSPDQDQFSIDVGLNKYASVGTNFVRSPDFNGGNQSYVTQGLNLNIGWSWLPTGGAISAPSR